MEAVTTVEAVTFPQDGDIDVEDTRSELCFDITQETDDERLKRMVIERALEGPGSCLDDWRQLALGRHGLVGDDLRRRIWPLLLELDPNETETTPTLDDLADHSEYQQVVLDVNRSLKRFPPGIPYKQRVALQDQLTVLILRVIMKYPHLRYYQGYHDVAITFLLVVGEAMAFRIMERLSTDHLSECMEPTMDKTSYKLNYVYGLLGHFDPELHDYLDKANVGTMFALPWHLTWFGHSLNRYRDVVRLYDYFLASPSAAPLYVTAALVVERRSDILDECCDMASLHCLLSRIPDDLNFEAILCRATTYYAQCAPATLEQYAEKRVAHERAIRAEEECRMKKRMDAKRTLWVRISTRMPAWLTTHYVRPRRLGLLMAVVTVAVGYCAYYVRNSDSKHSIVSVFDSV